MNQVAVYTVPFGHAGGLELSGRDSWEFSFAL
jgi:hypothetical protein